MTLWLYFSKSNFKLLNWGTHRVVFWKKSKYVPSKHVRNAPTISTSNKLTLKEYSFWLNWFKLSPSSLEHTIQSHRNICLFGVQISPYIDWCLTNIWKVDGHISFTYLNWTHRFTFEWCVETYTKRHVYKRRSDHLNTRLVLTIPDSWVEITGGSIIYDHFKDKGAPIK